PSDLSRLPACFLREARGVNIMACPISCLCRTSLYGCLGNNKRNQNTVRTNPNPFQPDKEFISNANEVSKPACMVRFQALLLKALAPCPSTGFASATTIKSQSSSSLELRLFMPG